MPRGVTRCSDGELAPCTRMAAVPQNRSNSNVWSAAHANCPKCPSPPWGGGLKAWHAWALFRGMRTAYRGSVPEWSPSAGHSEYAAIVASLSRTHRQLVGSSLPSVSRSFRRGDAHEDERQGCMPHRLCRHECSSKGVQPLKELLLHQIVIWLRAGRPATARRRARRSGDEREGN